MERHTAALQELVGCLGSGAIRSTKGGSLLLLSNANVEVCRVHFSLELCTGLPSASVIIAFMPACQAQQGPAHLRGVSGCFRIAGLLAPDEVVDALLLRHVRPPPNGAPEQPVILCRQSFWHNQSSESGASCQGLGLRAFNPIGGLPRLPRPQRSAECSRRELTEWFECTTRSTCPSLAQHWMPAYSRSRLLSP